MDEQTPGSSPQPSSGGGSGKAIGIVIAIVIIALLAWYFTKNGSKTETKSDGDTTAAMQQSSGQPTSLKELMAGSKSQKCDVSFSSDKSQSQGTIYVGGDKFRGDFSATVNGKTVVSHMINDQQNSYVWMDGMGTGYKMAVSAAQPTTPSNQDQPQTVDPNAKYDYHCSAWSSDSSQFSLPSGVTFTDMSAMMQTGAGSSAGGANSSASMKAQQCAACDQAGASKAQCLAALKCE